MIKPRPDFERTIARAGIKKSELARGSGVGQSTIYGALRQQQKTRAGGMYEANAWKIANFVASVTKEDADKMFDKLFERVEYISPVDGRRITQTSA